MALRTLNNSGENYITFTHEQFVCFSVDLYHLIGAYGLLQALRCYDERLSQHPKLAARVVRNLARQIANRYVAEVGINVAEDIYSPSAHGKYHEYCERDLIQEAIDSVVNR